MDDDCYFPYNHPFTSFHPTPSHPQIHHQAPMSTSLPRAGRASDFPRLAEASASSTQSGVTWSFVALAGGSQWMWRGEASNLENLGITKKSLKHP